jgi:hypothetical protein
MAAHLDDSQFRDFLARHRGVSFTASNLADTGFPGRNWEFEGGSGERATAIRSPGRRRATVQPIPPLRNAHLRSNHAGRATGRS